MSERGSVCEKLLLKQLWGGVNPFHRFKVDKIGSEVCFHPGLKKVILGFDPQR